MQVGVAVRWQIVILLVMAFEYLYAAGIAVFIVVRIIFERKGYCCLAWIFE